MAVKSRMKDGAPVIDIGAVRLDAKRPLRSRAVWLLSLLHVLGNVASIPLVQQTQPSRLEGPSLWALATAANFILTSISRATQFRGLLGSHHRGRTHLRLSPCGRPDLESRDATIVGRSHDGEQHARYHVQVVVLEARPGECDAGAHPGR